MQERSRSGFHKEPGPGVSNRKAERRGHRVVVGEHGEYFQVPLNRTVRGPGRYSGARLQPVPVQA